MAKENLMIGECRFNATHQQIVFTVTRRFYELNTARQKVQVCRKFGERSAHSCAVGAGAVRPWTRDQTGGASSGTTVRTGGIRALRRPVAR